MVTKFVGANMYLVLEDQSTLYRLLGEAYVNGILNWEHSTRLEDLRYFCIQ